jgi:glycosyltransferase involved in cell wall biosynthesis
LKILQINASYKPAFVYGGPTMSVSKLSEELVKAGVVVDVFTTTANGERELDVTANRPVTVEGVQVTYFTRITGDPSHVSPRLLWALWKNAREYDVIHIHAWWNLVSVFSALIAQFRQVPVLISPRGTLSSYTFNNKKSFVKKSLHRLLGVKLLTKSYIHATSAAEYRNLVELFKAKKIINLPNFVELPSRAPGDYVTAGPVFKLLFLSRIEQKKGLDLLLDALPLIKFPYILTIAGSGDKDYIAELKKKARNNLCEDRVSWAGFQGENKFTLLEEHHLMVLPSYDENFGNVVIESLAMGTAVLVSEYVGLADYVKANRFGWVCGTDVDAIAGNINAIVSAEQDELLRINKEAPVKIAGDFNEQELVRKYIDHYKAIIADGRI